MAAVGLLPPVETPTDRVPSPHQGGEEKAARLFIVHHIHRNFSSLAQGGYPVVLLLIVGGGDDEIGPVQVLRLELSAGQFYGRAASSETGSGATTVRAGP